MLRNKQFEGMSKNRMFEHNNFACRQEILSNSKLFGESSLLQQLQHMSILNDKNIRT